MTDDSLLVVSLNAINSSSVIASTIPVCSIGRSRIVILRSIISDCRIIVYTANRAGAYTVIAFVGIVVVAAAVIPLGIIIVINRSIPPVAAYNS
jgi:hypothetical protein